MRVADKDPGEIAEALHSSAVRLLRRLAQGDSQEGVPRSKMSALSVLVFGGAMALKDLAAAEQVRAPTMSRLVSEMEMQGLVRKRADKADQRAVKIEVTALGRRLLQTGRARRLKLLLGEIEQLPLADRRNLSRSAELIAQMATTLNVRARQ